MNKNIKFIIIILLSLFVFFVFYKGLEKPNNYLPEKNLNEIDIIGINYKDKQSNAREFLSELGNPYLEVLIDLDGTKSIELGAIGVPETYLIKNKIILKKYIGPLDDMKLKEIIKIIKK